MSGPGVSSIDETTAPSRVTTASTARAVEAPWGLRSGAKRVLVVDDDPAIRLVVRLALEREGFVVTDIPDGTQVQERLAEAGVDLVVLDVNLPDVGGFDVLTVIRSTSRVPVIMLTGRADEIDRVLGLELGADDYVLKPFSARELASRVRAVLRRMQPEPDSCEEFGEMHIDGVRREVRVRGEVVDLTAREFDLLAFLAASPQRVYARDELLACVWHSASDWQDPATVTEHVRRIRAKIEDDREHPRWIRTVRGAGYTFVG